MIDIQNKTKFKIDKKTFSHIAKKVLSGENKGKENLSLAIVSSGEIRNLNKKFRKKDKPTDVLSFELKDKIYLGEIIICPEVVKKNAKENKITFKKELYKIFIHGILHLLGYDHEKSEKEAQIMEAKQENYLSKFIK